MNIYQIKQDLLAIFDEIEENGGELTEELASQLEITKESFRNKCESYANVIKSVKSDIAAIDAEKKRLDELKKSKTALIERLSNIMIEAINQFGDTSKSGAKFVDYGTGKLIIRNSEKVEVDENKVDAIANEFSKAISFEAMLGNASNREGFTYEDIIQRCKEHQLTLVDTMIDDPQEVTANDIMATEVEIAFRKPLCELMSTHYNVIKEIASIGNFGITPKIDKRTLKNIIPEYEDKITIGKIVPNKTLTIR